MSRFLIVYGTTEGQTAQIAERMAKVIRLEGHEVDLHDSKEANKHGVADGHAGIIIGGSVHAGDHQSSLREFVKKHRATLESTPSAFFSVSLAAAMGDEEASAECQAMIDKFVRETGWQPARVERIAGALVYTHYNFFIRYLMKLTVKHHGRAELDTSKDYEFTDWDAVEAFARDFAKSATGTAGTPAGA